MYDELNTTSTALSGAINSTARGLSNYIDDSIEQLSNAVQGNYISAYDEVSYELITEIPNPDSPYNFTSSITMYDGKIIDQSMASLSDLMAPKHWKISLGGIAVDSDVTSDSYTVETAQGTIEFEVSKDCYVNCMISANEYDSSSPIQVWLSSLTDDYGSSSSALYCTLNNPGGFSGKEYFTNYHFSIPVKHLYGAKIILKHEDSSTQF